MCVVSSWILKFISAVINKTLCKALKIIMINLNFFKAFYLTIYLVLFDPSIFKLIKVFVIRRLSKSVNDYNAYKSFDN